MYICICKGITDKQVEEAKTQAKSFKDLCKKLGLGSECGTCIKEALSMTPEYAKKSTTPSPIKSKENI